MFTNSTIVRAPRTPGLYVTQTDIATPQSIHTDDCCMYGLSITFPPPWRHLFLPLYFLHKHDLSTLNLWRSIDLIHIHIPPKRNLTLIAGWPRLNIFTTMWEPDRQGFYLVKKEIKSCTHVDYTHWSLWYTAFSSLCDLNCDEQKSTNMNIQFTNMEVFSSALAY